MSSDVRGFQSTLTHPPTHLLHLVLGDNAGLVEVGEERHNQFKTVGTASLNDQNHRLQGGTASSTEQVDPAGWSSCTPHTLARGGSEAHPSHSSNDKPAARERTEEIPALTTPTHCTAKGLPLPWHTPPGHRPRTGTRPATGPSVEAHRGTHTHCWQQRDKTSTCLTRVFTGHWPPPTPQTLSSRDIPCFMLTRRLARLNTALQRGQTSVRGRARALPPPPTNLASSLGRGFFPRYSGGTQSSATALARNVPMTCKGGVQSHKDPPRGLPAHTSAASGVSRDRSSRSPRRASKAAKGCHYCPSPALPLHSLSSPLPSPPHTFGHIP